MKITHDTETQTVTIQDGAGVTEMPTRDWTAFLRWLDYDDDYQAELICRIDEVRVFTYYRREREKRAYEEGRDQSRQRETAKE